MSFVFETRSSDSPLVEMVWRTESEGSGTFISTAESRWEMVVARHNGQTYLTLRGPETKASPADFSGEAEFFGIVFKRGTFMPHLPVSQLRDRNDVILPEEPRHSIHLHGRYWQIPDFDNADTFIKRLVRDELLVHDPIVDAVLQNQPLEMSLRTIQRRFLRATGLTRGTFDQIERAREAAVLLEKGVSIADAVYYAGYFDQPHLTRSLKRFRGQTPAELIGLKQFE